MDNICVACLCKDRHIYELGDLKAIYNLLIPESIFDDGLEVKLCWECKHLLKKCAEFQGNSMNARKYLQQLPPNNDYSVTNLLALNSFSNLDSILKDGFDYTFEHEETLKDDNFNIEVDTLTLKQEKEEYSPDQNDPLSEYFPDSPLDPFLELKPEPKVVEAIEKNVKPKLKIIKKKVVTKKVATKSKHVKSIHKPQIIKPESSVQEEIPKQTLTGAMPLKAQKFIIPKSVMKTLTDLAAKNKKIKVKIGDTFQDLKIMHSSKEEVLTKLVKEAATDTPKPPSQTEIYEKFSSFIETNIRDGEKGNISLKVMTNDELSEFRSNLRKNNKQYTNSEYKCDSCIIGYYNEQLLNDHKKAKHKENPTDIKCETCLCYIRPDMYNLHYSRHRVLYECQLCTFNSNDAKTIKSHMIQHRIKSVLRCQKCPGVTFKNRYALRVHIEKEHEATQFSCHLCNKIYSTKFSLKEHIKRHMAINKPETCIVCGKVYKNMKTLNYHYRNTHGHVNTEKFRCEICNITFLTYYSMKAHMKKSRNHITESEYKFICYICGKGFLYLYAMRDHINFVHEGKTEHVCKICDKMFSSGGGLSKHIKHVHEGIRYKRNKACNICGKQFTNLKTVKEHMNIHSGVRPFKCQVCGDTFKQSAALYNHTRLVHLGYKMKNKKVVKSE